jgi:hypothetical protein
MPIDNLKDLKKHFDPLFFMSYLTVHGAKWHDEYIGQMTDELLDDTTELWYTGWLTQFIDKENLPIG